MSVETKSTDQLCRDSNRSVTKDDSPTVLRPLLVKDLKPYLLAVRAQIAETVEITRFVHLVWIGEGKLFVSFWGLIPQSTIF